MDKLDKFLRPALAKRGLLKVATSAEVCFLAEKWARIPFKADSFSGGILKVSVESGAAASELKMAEDDLIKHINSKIGKVVVRSIRIVNRG